MLLRRHFPRLFGYFNTFLLQFHHNHERRSCFQLPFHQFSLRVPSKYALYHFFLSSCSSSSLPLFRDINLIWKRDENVFVQNVRCILLHYEMLCALVYILWSYFHKKNYSSITVQCLSFCSMENGS